MKHLVVCVDLCGITHYGRVSEGKLVDFEPGDHNDEDIHMIHDHPIELPDGATVFAISEMEDNPTLLYYTVPIE